MPADSLYDIINAHAQHEPASIAILAPNRAPLRYDQLLQHVDCVVESLNRLGLGRNDRIGLILPNGPEMAVAVLAVAAGATCVPLSAAQTEDEFRHLFARLRLQALLMEFGAAPRARNIAKEAGIQIVELCIRLDEEAGLFGVAETAPLRRIRPRFASSRDIALLLHTSGTTARPKVVPLTQANVCTSAHNVAQTLLLTRRDRCINVLPLFHVHGLIGALFSSIAAGGSVICTDGFEPSSFFSCLNNLNPTWYTAVPTIHQTILASAKDHPHAIAGNRLRFIRSSSSSLPERVAAELESLFKAPLINAYGMTEASHQITSNPLPPATRKPGSVGQATGTQVVIIDDRGRTLPPGETGEILVRGKSITCGYQEKEEGTERSFTADGWFRTGDQGHLDAEGYLFITGRLKDIVNRGGEKIAPLEVEELLMDHPDVVQAVAFSVPHRQLGEDLVAAALLKSDASAMDGELRTFLSKRLAPYKVPSQILIVDQIPRSPTGKVDRQGMSKQWTARLKAAFTPPRNPKENMLCEIWAEVLGLERVGIHDNFFELGGQSLLAVQVAARVRAAFHVEVSLPALFETPTIAGFSPILEQALRNDSKQPTAPLVPVSRAGRLPLSFAQERLWFLNQLEPGTSTYNMPVALKFKGMLDIGALTKGLQEIVRRHEMLRTVFPVERDCPVQRIVAELHLSLAVADLTEITLTLKDRESRRLARESALAPFELAHGPLFRTILLQSSEQDHMLLLNMHHIISDGWSRGVLTREMAVLYEAFCQGKPSPLPDLPIQYADFADWQRKWLTGDVLKEQLTYWKEQLHDVPRFLELPTDRPRPPVQTHRGADQSLTLSGELSRELHSLSRQQEVTLFIVLLAAFQALLHRYTGQEDILVGSPIANRNRFETEGLIGFFVNTLVLKGNCSGNPTFREFLGRVRETTLGAYARQDLPFERLVEELQPERDLSRSPLFQVMFNMAIENLEVSFPGLTLETLSTPGSEAKFDLSLYARRAGPSIHLTLAYNLDLFDQSTIDGMLEHFRTLLEGIVHDPNQPIASYSILCEAERQQLLGWNAIRALCPEERSVHTLFESQVKRTPECIALQFGEEQLSYADLNRRANQLAHHLRTLGVGDEVSVGVLMGRSPDLVVSILGILKAGGTYVPVDLSCPRERLTFIIQDSDIAVIITHTSAMEAPERSQLLSDFCSIPDGRQPTIVLLDQQWQSVVRQSAANPNTRPEGKNAAYITYTSGSTGQPKGVLSCHEGIVNYLSYLCTTYQLHTGDVVLQVASLTFDASVRDLMGPLVAGARLVLVCDEIAVDPAALLEQVTEHRVTCLLSVVPTLLNTLVRNGSGADSSYDSVRLVLVSGEALQLATVRSARRLFRRASVVNQYGPTETTMTASYFRLEVAEGEGITPLGTAIPNDRIYVLERRLHLAPMGMIGELHIGGTGVTRGYVARPERTAEKFLPDAYGEPGMRAYRTGDLGRYQADGNLVFIGRADHQVKVRGIRIEPGEVETVLRQHSALREALVVARSGGRPDTGDPAQGSQGFQSLVAYVVSAAEARPEATELRRFLREKLPEYMVPSSFAILEALPLTPHGKVDRRALPEPDATRPDSAAAYVAPQTQREKELAEIWSHVLGLERVGVHDNFFEIGGHSLLATVLIFRVRERFGINPPLRIVFESPTIAALAEVIDTLHWATQSLGSVSPHGGDDTEEGTI